MEEVPATFLARKEEEKRKTKRRFAVLSTHLRRKRRGRIGSEQLSGRGLGYMSRAIRKKGKKQKGQLPPRSPTGQDCEKKEKLRFVPVDREALFAGARLEEGGRRVRPNMITSGRKKSRNR